MLFLSGKVLNLVYRILVNGNEITAPEAGALGTYKA
jgi:hypothetical protein